MRFCALPLCYPLTPPLLSTYFISSSAEFPRSTSGRLLPKGRKNSHH